MTERQSIKIQLTPEQQEMVRRLSGQNAEVMEIEPDPTAGGQGGSLRFLWRLSAASGIPRQEWVDTSKKDET
ncbi:MAG: hypothetical protein ABJD11_11700 [Gemmatimonadota bacterium]